MMTSENQLLIELAGKHHDECISPAEMSRLEALLTNESMQRLFIEISNVHSLGVGTLSEQDRSLALKLSAVHDAIVPSIPHRLNVSTKVVPSEAASRSSAAYSLGQALRCRRRRYRKRRSKWSRLRVATAIMSTAALILLALHLLPQRGGVEVAESQTEDASDADLGVGNGEDAGESEKAVAKD